MNFNVMFGRALRAAKLDVTLYNEVEADASLNREALYVVIIVSVLSGIGSFLSILFTGSIVGALLSLIVGIAFGILAYYLFCYVAHWVGTSMFKGQGDVGEVLRTVGYASGVRAIGLLAFIPCIGWIIGLAGLVWWIAASVIALREALDIDTGNAIVTAVIGGVIVVVIYGAIAAMMALLGFGAASVGGLLN